MKAATLSIFQHLYASVAEQMGVTLGRTALSPNIKERLDFSCALFTGDGQLLAQAAHIPVHLGAMPASVTAAIRQCRPFVPGDAVIVNDPYLGGTHLPDVTLISPVFAQQSDSMHRSGSTADQDSKAMHTEEHPAFFVASRAHHADIGGMTPGSMPLSTELFQEGLIIPPLKLQEAGQINWPVWQLILSNVRTPEERDGDLHAQLAANSIGLQRLQLMIARYGLEECRTQAADLVNYAERMTRAAIERIPDGTYDCIDYLDGDGQLGAPLEIRCRLVVAGRDLSLDFEGTAGAVAGNLNAVPAITVSAAAYCVRCLALAILGVELPMNQGAIRPLKVHIPENTLLNPEHPNAVAAGNVETSQRVVDVIFGALANALPELIPAASQGTMNNITFGSRQSDGTSSGQDSRPATDSQGPIGPFAYYETIGGGAGAGPRDAGGHGMHVHMSNTRNTPIEALEYAFPIQVMRYALRQNSGGRGLHNGGDGLVRVIRFRVPARVTVVSERRKLAPYGLNGGEAGAPGRNMLQSEERQTLLPGNVTVDLQPDEAISIETPGGGGWGKPA
jgi:N-methylhydantoinase B